MQLCKINFQDSVCVFFREYHAVTMHTNILNTRMNALINILKPRHNSYHFADGIFNLISLMKRVWFWYWVFSMVTSSNGNGHRWIPLTKKLMSKQSSRWLFETSSRSLWRYCSVSRDPVNNNPSLVQIMANGRHVNAWINGGLGTDEYVRHSA